MPNRCNSDGCQRYHLWNETLVTLSEVINDNRKHVRCDVHNSVAAQIYMYYNYYMCILPDNYVCALKKIL